MKVLFILSGTTCFGGATKSFLNLIEFLLNKNVEISVICPDRNGVYNILKDNGIDVYSLKYRFSTRPSINNAKDIIKYIPRFLLRTIINRRATNDLLKLTREISPDIIHTNSSVTKIGYNVAQKLDIPHIFHIREYGNIDFSLNTSYITSIVSTGKSYSISITKDIARHKNILESRYNTVIYNGVVNQNKIRYNSQKEPFFLFAGRIEPTKGLGDLLDAYISYIKHAPSKYKLVIAGGKQVAYEKYYEDLRDKIAENGIEEYVDWVGERKDIDDYMYRASATIIPSIYEGFGRVMVEAMSNGCLCVARNTGGSKEQMDNGVLCIKEEIAYRYNSNEELEQHLLEISKGHNEERRNMIEMSQSVISRLYSQEKYGEAVFELYESILKV